MADTTRVRGPGKITGILVVVAFLLLVALGVLYVLRAGAGHASAGLSSDEQAALDAGKVQVANLITYRRASFEADWQRALDGTTGSLHQDQVGKKASTLQAITKDKIDLRGEVSAIGVASATKNSVGLVVLLNGYKITADGKSTLVNTSRLQITETKVGAKWLLSDLKNVPLS